MLDAYAMPLLIASAIACGLMSGLFFAFSISVMRALSRIPAESAIQVMQQINVVILNPVFAIAFFGPAAASVLLIVHALGIGPAAAWPTLVGAVVYLLGGVGVTLAFNVPLNNQLANLEVSTEASELFWARYLRRWTLWNHLRTLACLLSTFLFVLAISRYSSL